MFEGPDPAVSVRSPIELELLLRAGLHADAPPEMLGRLMRVARDGRYPVGATVIAAGQPPRRLIAITDGQVVAGASRMTRGAPLGMLDALIGRPHPEHVVAATALRTIELEVADYLAILDDHVDVSLVLIDKLAGAAHAAAVVARPSLASGVPDLPCVDAIERELLLDRMDEHVSLPRSVIRYLGWLIAGSGTADHAG